MMMVNTTRIHTHVRARSHTLRFDATVADARTFVVAGSVRRICVAACLADERHAVEVISPEVLLGDDLGNELEAHLLQCRVLAHDGHRNRIRDVVVELELDAGGRRAHKVAPVLCGMADGWARRFKVRKW